MFEVIFFFEVLFFIYLIKSAIALICSHADLFNNLCFYEQLTLDQYLLLQKQGFFAFRFFKV